MQDGDLSPYDAHCLCFTFAQEYAAVCCYIPIRRTWYILRIVLVSGPKELIILKHRTWRREIDLTTLVRSQLCLKYNLSEDVYYTVFHVVDHKKTTNSVVFYRRTTPNGRPFYFLASSILHNDKVIYYIINTSITLYFHLDSGN